ncbi:MAG TPA: hypothetical protein VNI01_10365, partial [Elusimicrobiota bacterium]|nr:hypothetical protein [Elusimicrobiota bacterium]
MPEQPDEKPRIDLSDIGSIQSLDTARMALRWALERLRVLDRSRSDAERGAARLEDELRARSAEASHGQLARARLESWLLSLLSERIDTAALREALGARMRALQDEAARRRAELEARLKAGPAAREGVPAEALRKTLEELAAQERRLESWEELIRENAQLVAARSSLAEKVRGLENSLGEEPAPPAPRAPAPASAAPSGVPSPAEAAWEEERASLLGALRDKDAQLARQAAERDAAARAGAERPSAQPKPESVMPAELNRALA